jgi:hypothetical protein
LYESFLDYVFRARDQRAEKLDAEAPKGRHADQNQILSVGSYFLPG